MLYNFLSLKTNLTSRLCKVKLHPVLLLTNVYRAYLHKHCSTPLFHYKIKRWFKHPMTRWHRWLCPRTSIQHSWEPQSVEEHQLRCWLVQSNCLMLLSARRTPDASPSGDSTQAQHTAWHWQRSTWVIYKLGLILEQEPAVWPYPLLLHTVIFMSHLAWFMLFINRGQKFWMCASVKIFAGKAQNKMFSYRQYQMWQGKELNSAYIRPSLLCTVIYLDKVFWK